MLCLDLIHVMFHHRSCVVIESLVRPGSGSDFLVRMGDICTELEREWDTVGLEASTGMASMGGSSSSGMSLASNGHAPSAGGVDDPIFGPSCNPDVPPREQAGFALAICFPIHIVELCCTSDRSHSSSVTRKRSQHNLLVHLLLYAGWSLPSFPPPASFLTITSTFSGMCQGGRMPP